MRIKAIGEVGQYKSLSDLLILTIEMGSLGYTLRFSRDIIAEEVKIRKFQPIVRKKPLPLKALNFPNSKAEPVLSTQSSHWTID